MSAKFIIIGRWITLAEAMAMYPTEVPLPGDPVGFLRGVSFYEHKPILTPPPISYGPKFNRGKRKIKNGNKKPSLRGFFFRWQQLAFSKYKQKLRQRAHSHRRILSFCSIPE